MRRVCLYFFLAFLIPWTVGAAAGNLVENSGFEAGIGSPWSSNSPTHCSSDSETFHDGSRSLRVSVTGTTGKVWMAQSFQVTPGESYNVGAWVKTEDVHGTGAKIFIEWSSSSAWLGGEYGFKAMNGTQDWQYTGLTVTMPEDATTATVFVSMWEGSTGTAWFDDVMVERQAKPVLQTSLLRPNYRGKLLPDAPSPEIGVEIVLSPEEENWTLGELEVTVALKNGGGEIVVQDGPSIPSSKQFNVDLDISASTPPGDYTLVIELHRAGTSPRQDTHRIEKLSQEAFDSLSSYIDSHNRFILDGEPFFPLGLYVAQCPNNVQFTEIEEITASDSPFDTLLNYCTAVCSEFGDITDEQISDYLDLLQERDLRLIFCLRLYIGHGQEDIEAITQKVTTFKDHPAIISWYLNDELGPEYLAELEERYLKVIELDENHPVWSVHWNTNWLLQERDTTDLVGVDPYPIDNHAITLISQMAEAANDSGKPLWLVPQIFNWKDYPGDDRWETGRPPMREEMRAMTYLAVNHGAKGLIYYSYFNILDDEDYGTRWPQIKDIGGEVDQMRAVFLSIHQTNEKDIVCQNANIDHKLFRAGNTYYLIAVNTTVDGANDPLPASGVLFDMNTELESSTVDTLFEGGREISVDSNLLDDFGPYEVHVYKWEGAADKDGDGFSSAEEWGPKGDDPNYDGNGDGNADSEYTNAASGHTFNKEHYVTLAVSEPGRLSHCEAIDNPDPANTPFRRGFPYGFFLFRVGEFSSQDGCKDVTLLLPRNTDIETYYKYGRTPDSPDHDHWYEFMFDGETGAEIFHEETLTRIVLHLCDGKRGDDDRDVDGKIVDAGGPAIITTAAPNVVTGAADSVTSSSAKLSGTINPNGESTTSYFEYGTTASYGSSTTGLNLNAGDTAEPVSEDITGLTKGTTYHFRLVATNSQGTTHGDDMTFKTSGGGGGGGGGCIVATAGFGLALSLFHP